MDDLLWDGLELTRRGVGVVGFDDVVCLEIGWPKLNFGDGV